VVHIICFISKSFLICFELTDFAWVIPEIPHFYLKLQSLRNFNNRLLILIF